MEIQARLFLLMSVLFLTACNSTINNTRIEKNKSLDVNHAMPECETLLAQLSSVDEIYFLCDKGDVVFTKDLGQSWQHVIKIDIADMQLKFNELVEATKAEKLKQQAEVKSQDSTQL
ncbi:hypothetical protein [Shewanella aestuarii]|uniref:Uncharacterized protein n=1 Tax=Shewanella aestuarii TaxID=1028752 RepID=A0A6G9QGY9_9GAMM|nr:hypothetical protein [Shewanella aestuarii]QIR13433.1 hypothetical protein HBH39_02085 [Shewanella aestuarii]